MFRSREPRRSRSRSEWLVAEIPRPDDLGPLIADLLRRVRELETAAGMKNTSMRGGAFRVLDENSNVRVELGTLGDWGNGAGDYGIAVLTPQGRPLFLVDQDAQHVPWGVLIFLPHFGLNAFGFVVRDTTVYEDFMAATQLVTAPFFHWNLFIDPASSASVDWQIQATIAGSVGWVTIAGGNALTGAWRSSIGSIDLRTTGLGSDVVGRNVDYRVQLKRNGGSGQVGFRLNFPPVLRPTG